MNLVPAQRIGVNMLNPLVGMPQGAEWLIILAIVILVFGAAKLPDLARSSGQALRIFKAETKGLADKPGETTPAASDAAPTATLPPAPAPSAAPAPEAPAADNVPTEHREA